MSLDHKKNPKENKKKIIQYTSLPIFFYMAAKLGVLKQGTLEEYQQQR
jgi:hypothetical protein